MKILIILSLCLAASYVNACKPSPTTVSGSHAPAGQQLCSGQLIFEDIFNTLDQDKWRHDITLGGGGNSEFQWYVNDRNNSFVSEGNLHLKPTFTSDLKGESFLTSGQVNIPTEQCTQGAWSGCDKEGSPEHIINPIRSARVDTWDSFRFKFGTVEIRAKTPAGDWLWPALWMMPRDAEYGDWPRSGEIDIMENRGNRQLFHGDFNVGVEQIRSSVHCGVSPIWTKYFTTSFPRNQVPSYDKDFHIYKVIWTEESIMFFVDDNYMGWVGAEEGFWKRDVFNSSEERNPWVGGTKMAPFDKEFFLIMNLAVGGKNFFVDDFVNRNSPKPWHNESPRAAADFWNARAAWEPTWNRNSDDSHFQVDWVRVHAL